jgi:hypothetical protein
LNATNNISKLCVEVIAKGNNDINSTTIIPKTEIPLGSGWISLFGNWNSGNNTQVRIAIKDDVFARPLPYSGINAMIGVDDIIFRKKCP